MRAPGIYPQPSVRLRFAGLRRACVAALVPLDDVQGWALPDGQVALAVRAARDGTTLAEGVCALVDAIVSGRLVLGSRHRIGPPDGPELLTLASVLRSQVADEAVR